MSAWARPAGHFVPGAVNGDAELQQTEGDPSTGSGSTITFDAATKRNAAPGSIAFASTGSGSSALYWQWGLQGNFGWYVRWYFLFGGLPAIPTKVLAMFDNIFGHYVALKLTAAGVLQLVTYDGTTEVQKGGDAHTPITVGAWQRLELYGKFDAAGTSCEAGAIIGDPGDGSELLGPFTGLTLTSNMVANVVRGWVDNPAAAVTVNVRDGGINNDQGSAQTSWCGPCFNVLYSLPTGDAAVGANWLNGAGAATALWDAVNNQPPTGVADGSSTATSQIKNAVTTDATGNYDATMQTYVAAGMPMPGSRDAGGKEELTYVRLAQSVIVTGTSTSTNIHVAQSLVSNPAQGSEDLGDGTRGTAIGTWGTQWKALWGTAQVFGPGNAPTPDVAPVMRVGRRSASAETGTLSVAGMAIAFEVARVIPPTDYSQFPKRLLQR